MSYALLTSWNLAAAASSPCAPTPDCQVQGWMMETRHRNTSAPRTSFMQSKDGGRGAGSVQVQQCFCSWGRKRLSGVSAPTQTHIPQGLIHKYSIRSLKQPWDASRELQGPPACKQTRQQDKALMLICIGEWQAAVHLVGVGVKLLGQLVVCLLHIPI